MEPPAVVLQFRLPNLPMVCFPVFFSLLTMAPPPPPRTRDPLPWEPSPLFLKYLPVGTRPFSASFCLDRLVCPKRTGLPFSEGGLSWRDFFLGLRLCSTLFSAGPPPPWTDSAFPSWFFAVLHRDCCVTRVFRLAPPAPSWFCFPPFPPPFVAPGPLRLVRMGLTRDHSPLLENSPPVRFFYI